MRIERAGNGPRPGTGLAWPLLRTCVLAMLGASAAVQASDERPVAVGAGIRLGSDDNVFRAPASQAFSSNYVSASAHASTALTSGRQRLEARGELRATRYDRRSDLNNEGFGLDLAWRGSSAGNLSWTVAYSAGRQLASYASTVRSDQRVANVETSQRLSADGQLGLYGQWVALAHLSHRRLDYSAAAYASDRIRLDALGAGVRWNPLGPLTLQGGPRLTLGYQPDASVAADGSVRSERFTRYDADLQATWVASGASTFDARLSLTEIRYDRLADRDFQGATGSLGWRWQPTGKTRLNLVAQRDTGSETSFVTFDFLGTPLQGTGDSSRLTSRLTGRLDLQATGKIGLYLIGTAAERSLAASTRLDALGAVISDESGSERSASLSVGVNYRPLRTLQFICEVQQARRATSTSLSSPYRVNAGWCGAYLNID